MIFANDRVPAIKADGCRDRIQEGPERMRDAMRTLRQTLRACVTGELSWRQTNYAFDVHSISINERMRMGLSWR
jgi:hypothetical protein